MFERDGEYKYPSDSNQNLNLSVVSVRDALYRIPRSYFGNPLTSSEKGLSFPDLLYAVMLI
jgi:hypothetical protein